MKMLKKLLFRIYSFIKYLFYKAFSKNLFKIYVNKWFAIDGDKNLLSTYELNEDSIVFEVGGYTGVFSNEIVKKYNCNIYVFEPIKEYYEVLKQKFGNNKKVKIFHCGLANKTYSDKMYKNNDGSSFYKKSGEVEKIEFVDVYDFIIKNKLSDKKINLISINIEGGEYDLLNRILDTFPNLFKIIQVQFHDFYPNAYNERLKIIKRLKDEKYKIKYSFPFVRESFYK